MQLNNKKRTYKDTDREPKLTDRKILQLAISMVLPLFNFAMIGTYGIKDLIAVVLRASAKGESVNQAASRLIKAPSAQTVRHHLRAKIKLKDVEGQMNQILARFVECVPRGPLEFAIDITNIPYHGQPKRKNGREIRRSQRKAGTTKFHAYATLYVVLYNRRFTIAMLCVRPGDSLVHILKFFLDVIDKNNLKIKVLLLDREFYSARTILLLKRLKVPTIMPVRKSKPGTGVTKLFCGKKSYVTHYTLKTSRKKRGWKARFPVFIIVKYAKGQRGKHGIDRLGYVVLNNAASLEMVHKIYRQRFGIESSYRLMNISRARTSSRSPAIRLLYVVISLALQNMWVYLKWKYIYEPRQGGRKVRDDIFRFRTMLDMMVEIIGRIYQVVRKVWTIREVDEKWMMRRFTKSISQVRSD
jgi:hypothetical protein